MNIQVKQEHIDNGMPVHPSRCPIALAIRDVTNFDDIMVCSQWVDFYTGENYKRIYFSRDVIKKIMRLDNFLPIEPFSFELNLE